MKLFYLTSFFLLVCTTLLAQTSTITGKVHLLDGTPVAKATLRIEGSKIICVSDDQGLYKLENVPYGNHSILVTSVEIKSKKLPIAVNKPSYDLHIHIDPRGNISLDEVRVQGNSVKRQIETKGFAVNVIETKEAALQNIQTNELLERTAGVKLRQEGGLGSRVVYNINGISGNGVRIFIDGVPISNYGPSYSLNSLPPALIERIEVFKGVLPGYLSEDALGGGINIVLKNNQKKALNTSYSYGSFNTHQWQGNGSYTTKNGLLFRGSGFYNYSDNNYSVWGEDIVHYDGEGSVSRNHENKRFNDAYRSFSGKFDFGVVNKKWADQLIFSVLRSDSYKEIQHGVAMTVVYGNRHSKQDSWVNSINYQKKNLLIDGLDLSINGSYSDLTRQTIDTIGILHDWRGPVLKENGDFVVSTSGAEQSRTGKSHMINDEKTYLLRANLKYEFLKNHSIYVNGLYNSFGRDMDDLHQTSGWRAFINLRDLKKQVYAFTYESLLFEEKLRANVFYKLYQQDILSKQPVFSNREWSIKNDERSTSHDGYGFALSYKINNKIYLLGSAESAIRLPSEDEVFGNDADNIRESLTLNPEKSKNLNLGANLGPFEFDKHAVSFNTNIFLRDIKGMIRRAVEATSAETSSFENLDNVQTRGFDVEFKYRWNSALFVNVNATKFNALFNTEFDEKGARYSYYKTQIRNEPSFKLNSNVSYDINQLIKSKNRLMLNYSMNYVNKFLRDWYGIGGTGLNWIPKQLTHDIGALYDVNDKFTLSFDVKNITNSQLFDNYAIQRPGRAFYTKLTYSIF